MLCELFSLVFVERNMFVSFMQKRCDCFGFQIDNFFK